MSKELQDRTKKFAISIIKLVEKMEYSMAKKVVQVQLLKSATSVAANYRAACRGRSDREFIAKLNIVLEETTSLFFGLKL